MQIVNRNHRKKIRQDRTTKLKLSLIIDETNAVMDVSLEAPCQLRPLVDVLGQSKRTKPYKQAYTTCLQMGNKVVAAVLFKVVYAEETQERERKRDSSVIYFSTMREACAVG